MTDMRIHPLRMVFGLVIMFLSFGAKASALDQPVNTASAVFLVAIIIIASSI